MSDRVDLAEWLSMAIDAETERIMYGDGTGGYTGLLSMQPPEPAKLPEILSRQLVRQRDRLEVKGRTL